MTEPEVIEFTSSEVLLEALAVYIGEAIKHGDMERACKGAVVLKELRGFLADTKGECREDGQGTGPFTATTGHAAKA